MQLFMKQCFKCCVSKSLSEFYQHSQMADGHLNKCKECTKKDVAERYIRKMQDAEWIKKERARCREKQKRTPVELRREKQRLWRLRTGYVQKPDPVKRYARVVVGNAIRAGKLTRQSCQVCGAKAHAHHPDYTKPFKVIWLCAEHHGEQHRRAA